MRQSLPHCTYRHHTLLHCLNPLDSMNLLDSYSVWQMLTQLGNSIPLYRCQNTLLRSGQWHCHNNLRNIYLNMLLLSSRLLTRTYLLGMLYMLMHRLLNNNPWHNC